MSIESVLTTMRVAVNTTSTPPAHRRPVFVDCHSRRLGIDRQCTHSLHRNDMAYCHFELCRDCGLRCFSELLLADIRRLSVVAVVFLYQITVFLHQNTTASLLDLYSMQTVYACGGGGSQQRGIADGDDGWMDGWWGRCNIYRHRNNTNHQHPITSSVQSVINSTTSPHCSINCTCWRPRLL